MPGTLRIKTVDLQVYEWRDNTWQRSAARLPAALPVVEMYKAGGSFEALVDKKDPQFLKGQLSPQGRPQGARINVLPNGKQLDKAFSLFAQELTVHAGRSAPHNHWKVIYKNPCGKFSYLYTLDEKKRFRNKKYRVVKEFDKYYRRLEKSVYKALKDKDDFLAVPMYTLLKTFMRVGNETYYKINHHQGLKTLKKENISIDKNCVSFDYIGKDGVPTNIKVEFPMIYIDRLRQILAGLDGEAFVFINQKTGAPLKDADFRQAFKKYCGKEFYPHIVRSYYATLKARQFLRKNKFPTKEEVKNLFLSIAEKLGHKRFAKKDGVWKESYTVTINHYIQPGLVRQIKALMPVKKKKKK